MRTRPTIAAAVITLNEAQRLPSLIESLHWVDEIVVVDAHSRDDSVAIAECYGCRTEVRAFDNFANQRNHAVALCRADWVLSIDADERPSAQFASEARKRLRSTRAAGFRVPIRSRIFGRKFRFSGTQDDRPLRLVRREQARWCGEVHERLQVDGPIERLKACLDHDTLPDLSAFLVKMRRYTVLEARARVAAGRAPSSVEPWVAPVREIFRRLIWKHGWLDGPEGWAFCMLSGLSAWVQVREHRRLWEQLATRGSIPSPHFAQRPVPPRTSQLESSTIWDRMGSKT